MARFEVLSGLPPYGPLAESFSATGHGRHREGFVVRFVSKSGDQWVGNFQPGLGGCSIVLEHPDGTNLIVIAGGQGYVVDPECRQCLAMFGADIQSTFHSPEIAAFIFENGLWFEAIGRSGHLWRSERISWDGMKDLVVDGLAVTGSAWHYSDRWLPFRLNLMNGDFTGGSYAGPDLRVR
jgi:hypothetical protein